MAISLMDNINIANKKQNVERDAFDTFSDMKAYNEFYLPDVFIALCYEDRNLYKFDRNNTVDEITGKWRLVTGGSFDDTELSQKIDTVAAESKEYTDSEIVKTKEYVDEEIAKAQLSEGEVDLSIYYKKSETNTLLEDNLQSSKDYTDQQIINIEFPVISVNGQTGDVEISPTSIGAVGTEEFSTMNSKVLTLEQTTLPTIQEQVNTNFSNISTLQNQVGINTTNITTLQEQIGEASANATTAYTKAQEAEIKVSAQQSTVTNLSNQISDLWVAANRHDDNISLLETDVAKKANSSEVYTMNQVDSMIAGSISAVYKYKGNVTSVSDLADITSPSDGHVYFVESESLNYAYTEGSWKPLAGIIDMSDYVSQADFSTALSSKADISAIPTKVSDLYNDEQHVTRTEVEAMLSSAGVGAVQTVNGKFGNVVLTAADVGAISQESLNTTLGNYYTKTEVDTILGDIASALDEINGEIV